MKLEAQKAMIETDRRAILDLKRYAEDIIASLPTGLIVVDDALKVLTVNRSFRELFGQSNREDLSGRDLEDILPLPRLRQQAQGVLASGTVVHGIDATCSENKLRLAIAGIRLAEEDRLLVVVEDVSEEQKLREEARAHEVRYRDLVQDLNAVVWEADPATFAFTFVSRRAEAILGHPVSRWLTEPDFWAILIHPEDREQTIASRRAATAQGSSHVSVYRAVAADGRVVWLHDIARVVCDEKGRVQRLRGVMVDIGERKRAEQVLARQKDLYAVLSQTNQTIVRCSSREELFPAVCRIAVEHGHFLFAWIGVINEDDRRLRLVARYGEDAGYMNQLRVAVDDASATGRGISGEALRTGRHAISNDFLADPVTAPWHEAARRAGVRAMASFPLRQGGTVIGVINFYAGEPGFFTEELLATLGDMATDVSFALDNFEREAQRKRAEGALRQSEARYRSLFDNMLNGFAYCRMQYDDHGRPVDFVYLEVNNAFEPLTGLKNVVGKQVTKVIPGIRESTPELFDIYGRVATTGVPERFEIYVEPLRHWFSISVYGPEKGHFVAVFDVITERKLQEQKIARLTRIQAVLSGINSAIVRIRDRDELFREACRIAVKAGQFPFAWIGVFDRKAMEVTPVAWNGPEGGLLGRIQSSLAVGDGAPGERSLVGEAVRRKKPVISNDADNDPRILIRKLHMELGIHSLAILPMLVSGETVAVLALHAEQASFFNEDEMKLLMELADDISFALDHIGKEEKLNYLAYYDSLTGLANRTLFLDRLSQPLHAKDAGRVMVALALIDLVRFRVINDTLGRHAGDELLRLVAQRLGAPHADYEPPARVGVNSFALELSGMRDPAEVAYALEGILRSGFGEPFQVQGTELRVAAKCGVALFPSDGGDAETLFRNAEAALARAKQSADAVMFYAPAMNARVSELLAMENKLRKAIEFGQFVLHYQPKLGLADNRITGVEALIRWNDPETGLVPPGRFIPVLEETGMIFEVGRWAMQQAVADYRAWAAKGIEPPHVAVNVSPLQLRHRDFVADVKRVAQSDSAAAAGLDLEITESVIMEDLENNIAKLEAVRKLGVNIAIDDFGTGYSSLSYLAKLPVSALKIDRSFIIEMTEAPQGLAIVSTIINLAHSLKLKVVAEGVETEEQSKLLKLLNCDELQGYLFSKPIPAEQLEALLARNPPPRGAP